MDDDHGWYDWRVDFAYNQTCYRFAYWLDYAQGDVRTEPQRSRCAQDVVS